MNDVRSCFYLSITIKPILMYNLFTVLSLLLLHIMLKVFFVIYVQYYSVGWNSITRLNAQKAPPPHSLLCRSDKKTFLQKKFPRLGKIELLITFSNFCP